MEPKWTKIYQNGISKRIENSIAKKVPQKIGLGGWSGLSGRLTPIDWRANLGRT